MDDAWTGEMTPHEALHPCPRPAIATSLTAATNHFEPQTSYLVDETGDAVTVARDGMIVQPSTHNASQPSGRFTKWPVHSLSQFRFDRLQCRTHALGHGVAMNGEPALLSCLGTLVREAKKVKRLRPALSVSFSSFDRITAELDQTRFPLVQLQAELGEPRAEFFQTRRCLAVVLETDHEVIRITHNNHIAAAAVLSPPLDPQVKHIVQEYVR